jgi:hypothetical protein
MRYLLTISITLAACFSMQAVALRAVGGRTSKSESNFFSSLGRIQAGTRGNAEVMVLGSSVTGRLPDRLHGFAGVANMGCDGGNAMDVIRAMDKGILPSAKCIVIEANTLHYALDEKPTEISQAMQRAWFRVGMRWPCVAAYARPAAFFYSPLLARRSGDFWQLPSGTDLGVTSRPCQVTHIPTEVLTPRQLALIHEFSEIIGRLHAKGARTLLVWMPPTRSDAVPPPAWILELARHSGLAWWDLGQEAAPGTVVLTDGVHMNSASAARTMVSLMKGIGHEYPRKWSKTR